MQQCQQQLQQQPLLEQVLLLLLSCAAPAAAITCAALAFRRPGPAACNTASRMPHTSLPAVQLHNTLIDLPLVWSHPTVTQRMYDASDPSLPTALPRRSGDLVMLDVVGRLEDGGVFLDTRAAGSPLVVQLGVTNKCEWCAVEALAVVVARCCSCPAVQAMRWCLAGACAGA
jgi:hypothetical protein